MKLHGVELEDAEKNRLKKSFSRANKINYTDALHSINIDLDTAVLNEAKWTVPKQAEGGKALQAQNSLVSGKAISHLSRMSLAELEKRNAEMNNETVGAAAAAAPTRIDAMSKAGSSVSKSVAK